MKLKIKVTDGITEDSLKGLLIDTCPRCKGSGITYGHGAFGEPERDNCNNCNGLGISLQSKK